MASPDEFDITRRAAIGAIGTSVIAGTIAGNRPVLAQKSEQSAMASGEILIRGGYVLPVDPALKDIVIGDVHVRDGEIVAVAESISAPGADMIDARDMIVMPGFIETHWHMWNSIWRGTVNDASAYFQAHTLLPSYSVEDHYTAVRYAALEAINAGITTCHNWAHGLRTYDDAEAELKALADSGIRAKLSYSGVIQGQPTSAADLRRALAWIEANGNGRLGLGMQLDSAGAHFADQVKLARELKLRPITDHGSFLSQPDLIGPEFIFTHGAGIKPQLVALIKAKDLRVALCPSTDPLIGNGLPPVLALISGGVPIDNISFSVDVTAQTQADPFAALRTLVDSGRIQQVEASKLSGNLMGIVDAGLKWPLSYRDAIRIGTLSGANVLGVADKTGSLTPGKRADIILVRKSAMNMLPAANTNPTYQLVQHGGPANVDTVIIDGRVLKRNGKIIGVDVDQVVAKAAAALTDIRKRAHLSELDATL